MLYHSPRFLRLWEKTLVSLFVSRLRPLRLPLVCCTSVSLPMKPKFPIYEGRWGTRLAEETTDPENPLTPPPPPPNPPIFRPLKRRCLSLKPRVDRHWEYRRRENRLRREKGTKLAHEEEMSPEKPRYEGLQPPPIPPPPPTPTLPDKLDDSPDRRDPTIFRHLPKWWFRSRTLPAWANVSTVAASKQATAEEAEEKTTEGGDAGDF